MTDKNMTDTSVWLTSYVTDKSSNLGFSYSVYFVVYSPHSFTSILWFLCTISACKSSRSSPSKSPAEMINNQYSAEKRQNELEKVQKQVEKYKQIVKQQEQLIQVSHVNISCTLAFLLIC